MSNGVIGIDEVGRGLLAGPITVCAVYIIDNDKAVKDLFQNTLRDSKKLSKSLRNNIYQSIRHNGKINYGIEFSLSSRSAQFIDKYGISKATLSCVHSCLTKLRKKGVNLEMTQINLDAGLKVTKFSLIQKSFIKGDERFVEIALSSIIAKVSRDTHMEKLGRLYPNYHWHKNAGYGTSEHRSAILIHGSTPIHRKSYLGNLVKIKKSLN